MLLGTLHGARFAPKHLASPERRLPGVGLREGHWPPENKPLPGGAGAVALWPSRRLLPGRKGLRTDLTGFNPVPAATRLLDCLKTMLGTLSLYMRPTKGEPFRADKDKRLVCPRRGDRVRGTA